MSWALRAWTAVALIAAIVGTWVLRGRAMDQYLETQRYEDIYYLPPAPWLKVMSLGYRSALADLIWLRALIYFGDEFQNRGAVRHVFNYGDSMIALDPDFARAYRWVGVAGMYTPKGSPIEFIERSIDVLRDGVTRFPNDGKMAWDAGAAIAYELLPQLSKDYPGREDLQLEANEYMMASARLGEGPEWLVLTNATLLGKLGQSERERRHLEEMYAIVKDPDVKVQIERRLSKLRDQEYVEAFRNANLEFEQRREAEFPYMPSALYFFVADPIESATAFDPG